MLTNWLLAQLAAEETWLRLSARWGAAPLASRCPHVPQRALAKQMDWPRWTKWPNVLQVAPEIAGPDRLWLSSFWRYVKDRVYVPPLPATVGDLQERITAAVNSVTPDMLQRVRSELDYCIDICRVTRGEGRGGGTLSGCGTTWNCMSLCNCSHQFCKNIPVSFDFITTWNQGVFLCSPYIYSLTYSECYKIEKRQKLFQLRHDSWESTTAAYIEGNQHWYYLLTHACYLGQMLNKTGIVHTIM